MNITSKQIDMFLLLAKNLSFSQTANEMYTTQPTISRQIAILEEELGCKLFERNKRHVNLTEEGVFWNRRFTRIRKMIMDGLKEWRR